MRGLGRSVRTKLSPHNPRPYDIMCAQLSLGVGLWVVLVIRRLSVPSRIVCVGQYCRANDKQKDVKTPALRRAYVMIASVY